MDKELCDTHISTQILSLMRKQDLSFDTSVILNLERKYVEEGTLTIKGTVLNINPTWFKQLNANDAIWNLRHVAWHLIGFDEIRVGDRDAERWNLACDLWINSMLVHDESFKEYKLPQDASYDRKFKNWDKDKIYDYLEQTNQDEDYEDDPMKNDCGGQGDVDRGDGDGDDSKDSSSDSNGDMPDTGDTRLEREIQNIIAQAAIQAKEAGNQIPSNVEEMLRQLYSPKLPWDRLLEKYMSAFHAYDYTYSRINKKFFPHGIILPTLHSERLNKIIIANDESCSVTNKEYETYLGSIKNIKAMLNPLEMQVLTFTTQVRKSWIIKEEEDISKIMFRSGGGTHIPCIFEYIEKEKIKPEVLIIFSDMESRLPTKQPSYDVIWIAVGNAEFKAPFGQTVHVEL